MGITNAPYKDPLAGYETKISLHRAEIKKLREQLGAAYEWQNEVRQHIKSWCGCDAPVSHDDAWKALKRAWLERKAARAQGIEEAARLSEKNGFADLAERIRALAEGGK